MPEIRATDGWADGWAEEKRMPEIRATGICCCYFILFFWGVVLYSCGGNDGCPKFGQRSGGRTEEKRMPEIRATVITIVILLLIMVEIIAYTELKNTTNSSPYLRTPDTIKKGRQKRGGYENKITNNQNKYFF